MCAGVMVRGPERGRGGHDDVDADAGAGAEAEAEAADEDDDVSIFVHTILLFRATALLLPSFLARADPECVRVR
jgi:hypothetical protein